MKAVVVYESHWGNTAAIARAIADGLGSGTPAFTTTEATADSLAGINLIVAGAPVLGFSLPTEQMIQGLATNPGNGPIPADISHPSLRSWLSKLQPGQNGHCAAFETRIWWSPGGSTKAILKSLERNGFQPVEKGKHFLVTGRTGPLKEGELERARQWGLELAKSLS